MLEEQKQARGWNEEAGGRVVGGQASKADTRARSEWRDAGECLQDQGVTWGRHPGALDGEQRGELKALGLGGCFLGVFVSGRGDLGLHGANPDCSEEGLWATSPGRTWLTPTSDISKLLWHLRIATTL